MFIFRTLVVNTINPSQLRMLFKLQELCFDSDINSTVPFSLFLLKKEEFEYKITLSIKWKYLNIFLVRVAEQFWQLLSITVIYKYETVLRLAQNLLSKEVRW